MSVIEIPRHTGAQSKKILWATVIGNGLVVYDFTVYSFFAVIIGQLFFPASSSFASLMMALLTFGAGFVMRPLGAIVIGQLADRKGRKLGLTVSTGLMALGTCMIAFAPTYASIGVAAPLLIVAARLMQGLAAGGEIGVSSVVLLELAARDTRCYTVSWRSASQAAAALAGALVGAASSVMLPAQALLDWGWRIPFMLGIVIGPIGWFIRRRMLETSVHDRRRSTLASLFKEHLRTLALGVLSMAAPTASMYLMVYYMPTYLVRTLHLPHTLSLMSAVLSSLMVMVAAPMLAKVADRQRLRKPIQYVTLLASIAWVYPVFSVLTLGVGEGVSLLIIGVFTTLLLSNNGVTTVMMMEAFPAHHRATGMSVIYSLGVTIFGAFGPFFVTWLIGQTGNPMAPAWYLLGALLISLFALVKFPVLAAEPSAPGRGPG